MSPKLDVMDKYYAVFCLKILPSQKKFVLLHSILIEKIG